MVLDPLYFIIVGPFMLLAMAAGAWVKMAFSKYSRIPTSSGMTGAMFARKLMDSQGLPDVGIEQINQQLGDHYDPKARVLRLSPDVYNGNSVAAVSVAAHEAGHALQHKQGYLPLMMRQSVYPLAAFGSNAWIWLLIGGIVLQGSGLSPMLMMGAIVCFGFYFLFSVITLPVEFNASTRAMAAIRSSGVMTQQESNGARAMLNAAAMTYVASVLTALATLIYLLMRARR